MLSNLHIIFVSEYVNDSRYKRATADPQAVGQSTTEAQY